MRGGGKEGNVPRMCRISFLRVYSTLGLVRLEYHRSGGVVDRGPWMVGH